MKLLLRCWMQSNFSEKRKEKNPSVTKEKDKLCLKYEEYEEIVLLLPDVAVLFGLRW